MAKFIIVGVHALINKSGKYLVTKRASTNDYMPNFWDIPGGSIRFGEEISHALKREVLEESGLKIKQGKIIFVYGYKSNEMRHQFQLVYSCDYLSGVVKLNPDEHSEYRWATLGEMKKLKSITFLKELLVEVDK